MSLVEQYHAERKARLARMAKSAAPKRTYTRSKNGTVKPYPPNYCWSRMWFWDLVNMRKTTEIGYIPPVRRIINTVGQHYGISANDIVSARRTADIVLPRQVAMYLARQTTPLSLPQISRSFGNRDHTTILHAIRRIKFYLERNPEMRATIDKLKREVGPI